MKQISSIELIIYPPKFISNDAQKKLKSPAYRTEVAVYQPESRHILG